MTNIWTMDYCLDDNEIWNMTILYGQMDNEQGLLSGILSRRVLYQIWTIVPYVRVNMDNCCHVIWMEIVSVNLIKN